MIEPPEGNTFGPLVITTVNALPWIIVILFFYAEMLCAPEVCAKIQDEALESGWIQQVGERLRVGFDFLVGYGEHVWCLLFLFVRRESSCYKHMDKNNGEVDYE